VISEKQNFLPPTKETLTNSNLPKPPRSEKKTWRPNKLPDKWEKLKKSPTWKKLSKLERQLLKLGWPNRHLKLSYSEIASLLHIQRNAAIRLMQKFEKIGFVTKKKNFIKKKNGSLTKIHKRNYYVFTDAGKAGIEVLLNRLFLHAQNEPLKDLTNVRKNMPSESLGSQDHFRNKKILEMKKIFKKYSFENQILRAYEGTIHILLAHSLEKVEKILKLIRRKIQKGWKLREFWGFFLKLLKKPQKTRNFFSYLAHAYLEASNGKCNSLTHGVDSRIIAESLGKLQKTGEMITEDKLARILHHGTQKIKTALEGICYRSYLGRGVLPQPQAELEETKEVKKSPITKLIKINSQTGKPYSNEDCATGKDFCMKISVVGYEEISPIKKVENVQRETHSIKIRSWIGLLIETLETCKDCESIYRRYFFSKNDQYV
jgi:hypothetical protein